MSNTLSPETLALLRARGIVPGAGGFAPSQSGVAAAPPPAPPPPPSYAQALRTALASKPGTASPSLPAPFVDAARGAVTAASGGAPGAPTPYSQALQAALASKPGSAPSYPIPGTTASYPAPFVEAVRNAATDAAPPAPQPVASNADDPNRHIDEWSKF